MSTVAEVLSSLGKGLADKTSRELDELLYSVATVGKQAARRILDSKTALDSPTQELELLLVAPSFLLRYLGDEGASTSKEKVRYAYRLKLTTNVARSAISRLVAITKFIAYPVWRKTCTALADCSLLIDRLSMVSLETLRTDLSNAFWRLYLESASLDDKLTVFLPTKLEKLAEHFEGIGEAERGAQCLRDSIALHQRSGVLVRIASRPLCSAELDQVRRLLTSYLRILSPCKVDRLFYDDENLSRLERGLLLELQLESCIKLGLYSTLESVHSTASGVYGSSHPVRLLRASICVAAETDRMGQDMKARLSETLLQWHSGNLAEDSDLAACVDHLKGRRDVYLASIFGRFDQRLIRPAISWWSAVLHENTDLSQLTRHVPDPMPWLKQLEGLADYLQLNGQQSLRAETLDIVVRAQQIIYPSSAISSLLSKLSACGLQYLRIGDCKRAEQYFRKARHMISTTNEPIPPSALLQWHMAYAEYALEMHQTGKSVQHITQAKAILKALAASTAGATSFSARYNLFCAAIFHARLSTKLTNRAWSLVEKKVRSDMSREQDVLDLTKDMDSMSLKQKNNSSGTDMKLTSGQSMETATLSQSCYKADDSQLSSQVTSREALLSSKPFWPLVPRLVHRLCHLSRVFAQEGLLLEARYYAEHAEKIVDAIDAPQYRNTVKILLGSYLLREGNVTEAVDKLETIKGNAEGGIDLPTDQATLSWSLAQARLSPVSNNDLQQAQLLAQRGASLRCLYDQLLASYMFHTESSSEVMETIVSHLDLTNPQNLSVYATMMLSRIDMSNSLEAMSGDPVYNIAVDSIMSCPSALKNAATSSRTTTTGSRPAKQLTASRTAGNRREAPTKDTVALKVSKAPTTVRLPAFANLLQKAFDSLCSVHADAQLQLSSAMLHHLSDLLVRALIMLSTVCPTSSEQKVSSVFTLYAMELGRTMSWAREARVLDAERLISGVELRDTDMEPPESISKSTPVDLAKFQLEYIDILPSNWTVISMSIDGHQETIRIARIRAGQSPFILAIPLNRHNSRDIDEEVFGFLQGKSEMENIIEMANHTAHETHDLNRKGAKTEWWKKRAALDAQLKDLLVNIQSVWFGGLRGVFSPLKARPELLARFQESFYQILNKHLPSRQKSRKGVATTKVKLDPRVMELFVGLGAPSKDAEIEEPLLDLLYFVVDILQFHGERNAYDEIDFDAITVETIDALIHYHEAVGQTDPAEEKSHMILVLDKAMHSFPWESLPCLRGLAISRLPSLGALRSRVLRMREQPSNKRVLAAKHTLNRADGAYILNPGSDLPSTETTFAKALGQLGTWTTIVNREPTESEISEMLARKALYLYLGHSSGGQYIRTRTIKQLDTCAVSLLMGCSSATLTEAGEFESYGTPYNYLQAGATAVVGTLWDVTDKDIDRFSLKMLEDWGLLSDNSKAASPVKKKAAPAKATKSKKVVGKAISESTKVEVEKVVPLGVGLDEALGNARDVCILPYLNGAAPVVYGIPVFLE